MVVIGSKLAFQRGLAESRKWRSDYKSKTPQERLAMVQEEEQQQRITELASKLKKPVYESELLKQSFESKQKLASAEAIFIAGEQRRSQIEKEAAGTTVQMETTPYGQYAKGTAIKQAPQFDTGKIFFEPTIYSKEIAIAKDPVTGKKIPIYDLRYTAGALGGGVGLIEDRPATAEEQEFFLKQVKTEEVGQPETVFGKIKTIGGMAMVRSEEVLEPAVSVSQKFEDVVVQSIKPQSIVGVGEFGLGKEPEEIVEFKKGVAKGIIPSTTGEVVITAASLGIGAGVGAGTRVGGAILTKYAPSSVSVVSKGLGLAGLGLGGAYGFGKIAEFAVAVEPEAKGEVIGSAGREIFAFERGFRGGSKIVGMGIGKFRTGGLQEVPTEKVIAPEFFEGQTYPAIKKGQTAGELLAEFKPKLPGEKLPAGYTAAAAPLTGAEFGRGTSELPGLYQAPGISPKFLGLSKESPSFANILDVLPGGLPTAFRVTPTSFELTPLVKPGQRGLTQLSPTKEFFSLAEKGKSYIPFVKTEKEAVIPFETGFEKPTKKFFFTFEGEKIPIFETKTIAETGGKITKPKFDTKDIIAYSRSSGKGPGSLLSGVSYADSSSYLPSSSSYVQSLSRPPSSGISYRPSDIKSSAKSFGPSAPSSSLFGSLSSGLSAGISRGRSISSVISTGLVPTTKKSLALIIPQLEFVEKRRRVGTKRKFKRRPSLVSFELDIKAPKIAIGEFSGLVARPIISKKKKRRK